MASSQYDRGQLSAAYAEFLKGRIDDQQLYIDDFENETLLEKWVKEKEMEDLWVTTFQFAVEGVAQGIVGIIGIIGEKIILRTNQT